MWAAALLGSSLLAQTVETVTLGRYEVHPTRILARFAQPEQSVSLATAATLRSQGFSIQRRHALTPGGVLLEYRPTVSLKSTTPDPKAQAEALAEQITKLRSSGLFLYVVPDYHVKPTLTEPNDARYLDGTLWGLKNTGQNGGVVGADVISDPDGSFTNAWDITTGSTNVIVAVIDTGMRYTHTEFATQMWRNPGEVPGNGVDEDGNGYVDDVYGINALAGNGDPWDDHGHGTHVGGTIGAGANDGFPHVGVSWKVQLMACKFLGLNGGFTSDAIESINYAVANKARILNNSWGGGPFNDLLLDSIIAASTNGVLFVAAAGNDSEDNDLFPHYPSNYDVENVISVAALDRKDKIAWFSNYGKTTVHIGAPGMEIFSAWLGSDTDYETIEGTSMAAPHVAGVAALVLAESPNASMLELRERIISTAVPVEDLKDKTTTGGRVNAVRALRAKPDGIPEVVFTPRTNSVLLATTNLAVFAKLSDLFPITNAIVTGEIFGNTNAGHTNIPLAFRNDGLAPDAVTNDNIYSTWIDLTPYTNSFYSNIITFQVLSVSTNDFPKTNTVLRSTNLVQYIIVDRPANDLFARGDKVPPEGAYDSTLILATNLYATTESGEPTAGIPTYSASIWYNWSPAADSTAIVDTAGSEIDTIVGVYTGNRVDRLTPIASASSGVKRQVNVSFEAKRGATYRIAVGGYTTNETGSIRLRVQPNGRPDDAVPLVTIKSPGNGTVVTANKIDLAGTAFDPTPNSSGVKEVLVSLNGGLGVAAKGTTNWTATMNLVVGKNTIAAFAEDYAENRGPQSQVVVYYQPVLSPNDVFGSVLDPSSPYFLKAEKGVSQTTNNAATKEFDEPFHAGNEGGRSVWWTWVAPDNGVLTLDTRSSSYDTLLGLYMGDFVYDLKTIASNDDSSATSRQSKIVAGVLSNEVYRIAVDGFGAASGRTFLNWSFARTNLVSLVVSAQPGGTVSPAGTFNVAKGSVQTVRATADPLYDFMGWEGGLSSPANPLVFTVDEPLEVVAVFKPHYFADDFESGNFGGQSWTSAGSKPWVVANSEAFSGEYSARSGQIGDSETSSLVLTSSFRGGAARFYYRVSSEEGWDWLEFWIDPQLPNAKPLGRWSGTTDWASFEFNIPEGTHTLQWVYRKDSRNSAGQDAAFIDALDLPLDVPIDPSVNAELTMNVLPSGILELVLQGQTNQIYVLQSSGNLTDWRSFSTNEARQGQIRLPVQQDLESKFFRARTAEE